MLSRLSCVARGPVRKCFSTVRTTARTTIPTSARTKPGVVKDWHYYGKLFLGGSAIVGGTGICVVGVTKDAFGDVEISALQRSALWPEYVSARMKSTYLYFGLGLAATAGTMAATKNFVALQNIMAKHPFLMMAGLIGATMGLSGAQRSIPYRSSNMVPKVALAAGLYGIIGTVLGPMMHVGGPAVTRAAMYTGALVAGLTLAAVTAPSERYLQMSGPLMMGFCVVAAASLASAFLPPTGMLGGGIYGIAVYGGVVLFSGMLLYDTQRIVKACELTPNYDPALYDPISQSMSIYMTTINLFIRIVSIVAGNRRK